MSGISLAVAPRSDPDHASERQPTAMLGGVMGSLRVIELQLVAFILVFSASGLVPLVDLAFPVATTLYLLAISRLAFPPLHPNNSKQLGAASQHSQQIFRGSSAPSPNTPSKSKNGIQQSLFLFKTISRITVQEQIYAVKTALTSTVLPECHR